MGNGAIKVRRKEKRDYVALTTVKCGPTVKNRRRLFFKKLKASSQNRFDYVAVHVS
jgi:hypothetical protein